MKVTMHFDLDEPGDKELYAQHNKTEQVFMLLWDIEQEIFRPARKHGYPASAEGKRLNELLETNGAADEVISLLEQMYFNYKKERLYNDE